MTMWKTLLVGAAVGTLLAVTAIGAAAKLLSPPTAAEVAGDMTDTARTVPLSPPDFYGTR